MPGLLVWGTAPYPPGVQTITQGGEWTEACRPRKAAGAVGMSVLSIPFEGRLAPRVVPATLQVGD